LKPYLEDKEVTSYEKINPELIKDFTMSMQTENDSKIIPLFTINNLDEKRPADGWNTYCAPIYKISESPDVINLRQLMNNSLIACIDYHKKNSIPLNVFLSYKVLKDNSELEEGKDYTINFDTFDLTTLDCNEYSTYRFVLYVNTLYINDLIDNILNLKEEK